MPGRPLCKNSLCMIDSRAQYKVYEPIRTSVRLHAGGWHTRAGHRFFPSVVAEHALLIARADRAAGRCRVRYCFDTVSTTVHRLPNAEARGKSRNLIQHGQIKTIGRPAPPHTLRDSWQLPVSMLDLGLFSCPSCWNLYPTSHHHHHPSHSPSGPPLSRVVLTI